MTDKQRAKFFEVLGETGTVKEACEAAMISRSWAYELRGKDDSFAAEWDGAVADHGDILEAEARRRALLGWDEPVFQNGECVGVKRKKSEGLLILLLKAAKPEKFRDRAEHRHAGPDGGPIQVERPLDLTQLSEEDLETVLALHAKLAAGDGGEGGAGAA